MSDSSAISVRVLAPADITDAMIGAFARLVPQLSSSAPAPTAEELTEMVSSDADHLLVAEDADGTVLGSMTLIVFRIPTGIRAWIEDVVVDGEARGRGVGELLNRHAIDLAYALGAKTIDLTSREAANRLYQKLGFEARTTNVYRHNPEADASVANY
jgi:ribosomal protein S18 acetylase RimI-like enzyme